MYKLSCSFEKLHTKQQINNQSFNRFQKRIQNWLTISELHVISVEKNNI